ncbi:hypothetical protein XI03_07800 [Bradyrhizobium sp. CCBAU 65884]|nr:hypothetical protein [Bradyrhizobium sp. CCBAU 65884]
MEQLANLLANGQLVLFIGAGISRQAAPNDGGDDRMPLWYDLAKAVAQTCGEDLKNYNDLILDLFDAIQTNQGRPALEEAVRKAIPESDFQPSRAHYELAVLPWHMVATTNYDNLLARALHEDHPIDSEQKYEWLSREADRIPKLVNIHGTLTNLHTLSGLDYNDWDEKNPRAYQFLEQVLLNKTVLFAGYSFSDPHLKMGLLPWIEKVTKGRGKRHFAWMWRPTPEQVRLFDKRNQIDVIPIEADGDWAAAFQQLKEQTKPVKIRIKRKRSRDPAGDKADDRHELSVVNGYKLFFHRTMKQETISKLSAKTGIPQSALKKLERVRTRDATGPGCFQKAPREHLAKIEHSLGCIGDLEYGKNDFIAAYMMFYDVNYRANPNSRNSTKTLDFAPDTKAVVFDFGGTLTKTSSILSTWEKMWTSVGYSTIEAGDYHRQFLAKKLQHQDWCDITAQKLRDRQFSRQHMKEIIDNIEPIDGLHDALTELHRQGTSLYIVSGSVKEIILAKLGKAHELFAEIKANEFVYDDDDVLKSIKGHPFDFEGKAKFVQRVIESEGCLPFEVLFVGNSLNDARAYLSGARTLCVNPMHVDFSNTIVWTDYIQEMRNLGEILSRAKRVKASDPT